MLESCRDFSLAGLRPVRIQQSCMACNETGGIVSRAGEALASWLCENPDRIPQCASVLELGSGAGLCAVVCACLGASRVAATDGDPVALDLCMANAAGNRISSDILTAFPLEWGDWNLSCLKTALSFLDDSNASPRIIVASDAFYDRVNHRPFEYTLRACLSHLRFYACIFAWEDADQGEDDFVSQLGYLGEISTVWRSVSESREICIATLHPFNLEHDKADPVSLTRFGQPDLAASFYINLDSHQVRRAQMEETAVLHGIYLERLSACTPSDAVVAELAEELEVAPSGVLANTASHVLAWRRIAVLPDDACALVLEDDVVLHRHWKDLLQASWAMAAHNLGKNVDLFYLDGIFVRGLTSALNGWLGPTDEGVHLANGVAFSSAYALVPDAARWLLRRSSSKPGSSAESYLMQLSEERGACVINMPRLALQRWDETVSSVSGGTWSASMGKWYKENYFPRYPWTLYTQLN